MAKRRESSQKANHAEFEKWLRSKNVSRRSLRRDPEKLKAYQQEWQNIRQGRRSGLLSVLPKIDLHTVTQNVGKAHEILNMIQSVRDMMYERMK